MSMTTREGALSPEPTDNLILDFEAALKKSLPFARSLELLLNTVERQTGADSVCLYIRDRTRLRLALRTGKLKRSIDSAQITLSRSASEWILGLQAPEHVREAGVDWRVSSFPEVLLNGLSRFTVAPLRMREQLIGVLTAGWRVEQTDGTPHNVLDGLASAAAELLERANHTQTAAHVLAEITELEVELADLKIADRATAILGQSGGTEQSVSIVQEHVQRVLEGIDAGCALTQQLQALRRQVQERKLLNRAKAFLQQTRRMSEEEAYLHLRNASRRNRRPLRDVAQEMLSERWTETAGQM